MNNENMNNENVVVKTSKKVIVCIIILVIAVIGLIGYQVYDNMNEKANNYTGSKEFEDIDQFKAPKLTFSEKKEYTELEGKSFEEKSGATGTIMKAIQTIKFSLDEKGGEIKSEAVIDMIETTAVIGEEEKEEPRYFYVDDTFAIFLREKGKSTPYFAGRVEDITKFQ